MMKNILKIGVVLGTIAGILTITNPTKEAYSEYVTWHLKDRYCQNSEISDITKVGCAAIAPLPPTAIKQVIEGYTRHKNYIFFSVYSTDVWGMKSQTLALGGTFLPL